MSPDRQIEDRLVMNDELAVLDSEPEIELELEPLDQRFVHALLKDDIVALALVLCAVHREVGVSQQLVRSANGRDRSERCRCSCP